MRVGMGYDVHKLVEGRKLILGGVEIPHTLGLLGHSDAHVRDLIMNEGYVIENIDATVIAQKPKLRPYIDEMEKNIADTLGIALNQINIKATTEEGLGFTGNESGISSQAICSLTGFYEGSVAIGGSDRCAGCGGCSKMQG